MAEFDSVLVYDGDCPFCSAAATALRQLPAIGAIAWSDEAAQAFLRAQFDGTPFALVLVDPAEGNVYLGREAAREVAERAGMPVLVQDILGDNYESIADAVRTVTGVERDPDPYHGVYPLGAEAREHFDDLAANARGAPASQFTRR
jgi:predicted DCC family thiol-disulfide oxidoreductase YuxK